MIIYERNPDGTRGRFRLDTEDPALLAFHQAQQELRDRREQAADRLRAVALRLSTGRFGRSGGAHRERRWRPKSARLLYRLISG